MKSYVKHQTVYMVLGLVSMTMFALTAFAAQDNKSHYCHYDEGSVEGSLIFVTAGAFNAQHGSHGDDFMVQDYVEGYTCPDLEVQESENQIPVITLTGNALVTVEQNSAYVDAGATASDPEDGNITGNIVTTGSVNTAVLGTTTITYDVEDSEGADAVSVTRTVVVVEVDNGGGGDEEDDTFTICHYPPGNPNQPHLFQNAKWDGENGHSQHELDFIVENYTEGYECPDGGEETINTPPVITLVGSSTTYVLLGDIYLDEGATATDTEDGDITANIVLGGTFATTTATGTFTITYDVTDSGSLSATTTTRTVVVYEGENPEPDTATLVFSKVVCDDESSLPNWGAGGPDISSSTAQDFVNASEGRCHLASGWQFEISAGSVPGPEGDAYGVAGEPWTLIPGSTDENGTLSYSFVPDGTLNVKEVLQEGYIPFSDSSENSVSAEIYCHTDVLNYDAWDQVTPEANMTYYCVAFNTLIDDPDPENTPPVLTLTGSSTVNLFVGDLYLELGATATDTEDGDITGSVVIGGDVVNTAATGTYVVTYDVTDSGSLSATTTTRTVIVSEVDDNEDDDEVVPPSGNNNGHTHGSRRAVGRAQSGEVLGATTDLTCSALLTDYLKIGWKNNFVQVTNLQSFLNDQGIVVPVTGFFGPLTHAAVMVYQGKHESEILDPWKVFGPLADPTGFVYKTTRYTINNTVCPGSEVYPTLP